MKPIMYSGRSMYPTLRAMDTLHVEPYNGQRVNCGDVIAFTPYAGSRIIAHRAISVDSGVIRTRGDNNLDADPWTINPDHILGRVIYAQRGHKCRHIHGGFLGRLLSAPFRVIRMIDSATSSLFRPARQWRPRPGSFRGLLPENLRIRVFSFTRPDGTELRLRMGKCVIGQRLPGMDKWKIRRPFGMFVDEAFLAGLDANHPNKHESTVPRVSGLLLPAYARERDFVRSLCLPGEREVDRKYVDLSAMDWSWIVKHALRHGLAPLFWHGLTRLEGYSHTSPYHEQDLDELSLRWGASPDLIRLLQESYFSTLRRNLTFQAVLGELNEALAEEKTACLLWKGGAMALEIYGTPALRPMDDLDLLVTPESVEDIQRTLQRLSFSPRRSYPLVWERRGVTLDLHQDVVRSERISSRLHALPLTAEKLQEESQPLRDYPKLNTLSPRDTLIASAVHAMKHGFSRDIWIADAIYVLDRHPGLSKHPANLLGRAEELRAIIPLRLLISLLATWPESADSNLTHELQSRPLGFLPRRFLKCYKTGRHVPHVGELFFPVIMNSWKERFAFFRETMFPSSQVMSQVFPHQKSHLHWLYYPARMLRLAIMGTKALAALLYPLRNQVC